MKLNKLIVAAGLSLMAFASYSNASTNDELAASCKEAIVRTALDTAVIDFKYAGIQPTKEQLAYHAQNVDLPGVLSVVQKGADAARRGVTAPQMDASINEMLNEKADPTDQISVEDQQILRVDAATTLQCGYLMELAGL